MPYRNHGPALGSYVYARARKSDRDKLPHHRVMGRVIGLDLKTDSAIIAFGEVRVSVGYDMIIREHVPA